MSLLSSCDSLVAFAFLETRIAPPPSVRSRAREGARRARSYHLQRLQNSLRQQRRRWHLAIHRARLSIEYIRGMRHAAQRREGDEPALAAIYRDAADHVIARLPEVHAHIHALRRRIVALEAAIVRDA